MINRSPGELQPVFDILLGKAMRLCSAAFGVMLVIDRGAARTVAAQGLPPSLAEWRRNDPIVSPPGTLLMRVLDGEPYVHILDLKDDDLYRRGEPLRRANVDRRCPYLASCAADARSRRAGDNSHLPPGGAAVLGSRFPSCRISRPRQSSQWRTRASLPRREALEQQTVTAEVLQVINSSPGDLAPVFDATLDKGHKPMQGLVWDALSL